MCPILTLTHRRVDHTLLRVDRTRQHVGPTCRAIHHRRPPPEQPLLFEFTLLFYVTVYNFLLLCCLLFNLNRKRIFGLDLFFFPFWFLFRNFFSAVTFHLNLHDFLGSLFRCLIGVFILPMVVSITNVHRGKSFLKLHSHLSFSFMISFLFFEICPIGVLVSLPFFLFFEKRLAFLSFLSSVASLFE